MTKIIGQLQTLRQSDGERGEVGSEETAKPLHWLSVAVLGRVSGAIPFSSWLTIQFKDLCINLHHFQPLRFPLWKLLFLPQSRARITPLAKCQTFCPSSHPSFYSHSDVYPQLLRLLMVSVLERWPTHSISQKAQMMMEKLRTSVFLKPRKWKTVGGIVLRGNPLWI
jgi:hypothetical protein